MKYAAHIVSNLVGGALLAFGVHGCGEGHGVYSIAIICGAGMMTTISWGSR